MLEWIISTAPFLGAWLDGCTPRIAKRARGQHPSPGCRPCRPPTVQSVDTFADAAREALFPSTECVPQSSLVPQLPTTFTGRQMFA
jgi:hypothetical protein